MIVGFLSLFVLLGGWVFPSSPHFDLSKVDLDELPGHLDEDATFDALPFETLRWAWTSFPRLAVEAEARLSFFALAMFLWATVGFLATALMFFIPFLGFFVVFGIWGVIPGLSVAGQVVLCVSAVLSMASAGLRWVWIDLFRIVFDVLHLRPELSDQCDRVFATLWHQPAVNERHNSAHIPVSVTFDGHVYTFESLQALHQQDKPLAWALLTFMLYAPETGPSTTNLFATLVVLFMSVSRRLYSWVRLTLKAWWFQARFAFVILWATLVLRPSVLVSLTDLVVTCLSLLFLPVYFLFWRGGFRRCRRLVQLLLLVVTLRCLAFAIHVRFLTARNAGPTKGFTPRVESFKAFWNNTIIDLGRVVDKVALPHFIRKLPDNMDADAINATNEILASLGWPTAPKVHAGKEPTPRPANLGKFIHHLIGSVDVASGMRQLNLQVAAELENLKGLAPEYKRSEQYQTIENELESVSRYFTATEVDLPDVAIDELWVLIGDIFNNSVLTPFRTIIHKWEKKYGLGPFWADPSRKRFKKLSRAKFIQMIGGIKELAKLWTKTFEVAPGLVPVSGISVKGEALPPKKWLNDVVRTVVSAPLTHYIMSTVWNYQPNHNFKFWTTNIKVGMPLNGINLSKLWSEHDAFHVHFAGDFTAFDSTVAARVADIIAKVRKKGFERHRDYAKICFLIDANYKTLLRTPMMTTSTGAIYSKEGGLSTGHSSTSMDNSLATTIYYLCVWKDLTGLSAHEFRYYCKLSNYGDDHILSWLATAPASWTKENIIKRTRQYGVELRDEEPSGDLFRMSFLSKLARRPNAQDVSIFEKLGIPVPKVVVYHDPVKLVGKAYAPSKDVHVDRDYRVKRLVSYLDLCAHHPDIYDKIRHDIDLIRRMPNGTMRRSPVPIPSYESVVRKWYDPNTHLREEDSDIDQSTEILDYSAQGYLEHFVNALAVLPDLVNPAIYNMGYTNYFMSLCGPRLHWPIQLLRNGNEVLTDSHLVSVLRKTPYDFLASVGSITSSHTDHSVGGLLVKHWLYMMLRGPVTKLPFVNQVMYIDKKIADLNFILNGYVQSSVRRLDLPIQEILLVAALDFVPDLPVFEGLLRIKVPSFSAVLESLYGFLLNQFWSRVPANMKQAAAALDNLGPRQQEVVIEAPTGSGKSTTFVAFVHKFYGHNYDRFIVVEPRAALPLGLTPYLRSAFGLPAHAVTEGHPFDNSMRLIVTTPQEVLLHPDWITRNNLFMIDEAHVFEPAMRAVIAACRQQKRHRLLVTATPDPDHLRDCDVHVRLQLANVWSVVDVAGGVFDMPESFSYQDYWAHYSNRVIDITRSQPLAKYVIFVCDIWQAESLQERLQGRVCVLSSENKVVDPKAKYFVCTSVADVGITIPDVDWVITSNIIRTVKYDKGDSVPVLTSADPSLIKQRRGRTGRTNNGYFTLISYKGRADWLTTNLTFSRNAEALSLLSAGVSVDLVSKLYPDFINDLLGFDADDPEGDLAFDSFVANYDRMCAALNTVGNRSYKTTVDGRRLPEFFTVAGNTIPSSRTRPRQEGEEGSQPKVMEPMTGADVLRFTVLAATWLARRGQELGEEDFLHYFRTQPVGGLGFTRLASKGGKHPFGQPLAGANTSGDPTGRWGARHYKSPKDLGDPTDGFDIELPD